RDWGDRIASSLCPPGGERASRRRGVESWYAARPAAAPPDAVGAPVGGGWARRGPVPGGRDSVGKVLVGVDLVVVAGTERPLPDRRLRAGGVLAAEEDGADAPARETGRARRRRVRPRGLRGPLPGVEQTVVA